MALEPRDNGRLFFVGSDQKMHMVDWTSADNPIDCPQDEDILPDVAAYKTDNTGTVDVVQNIVVKNRDSIQSIIISVFPNPSKGTFNFTITRLEEETDVVIKIEDLNGRVINEMQRSIQSGKREELIWDANNVNGGVYLYRLKLSNGNIFTGKLTKL